MINLASCLKTIISDEFINTHLSVTLMEGREDLCFKNIKEIDNLIILLEISADSSKLEDILNKFLDDLFEYNFKLGEHFSHTESVMVLLYAMKEAKVICFESIADAFSNSTASECSRLARFAKRLVKDFRLEAEDAVPLTNEVIEQTKQAASDWLAGNTTNKDFTLMAKVLLKLLKERENC